MPGFFSLTDQTNNYVTSKLINPSNVAGGSQVPAQQIGTGRIPVITGLKLGPVSSYLGGTQYSLIWLEPPPSSNVSHYNVFITGVLGNNSPLGPYASEASPCYLRLTSSSAAILTFSVQTVLNNGAVSSLKDSPSCTSQSVNPTVSGTTQSFIASATVTMNPSDYAIFLNNAGTGQVLIVNSTQTPTDGQQLTIRGAVPTGSNVIEFFAALGQTQDPAVSNPGVGIAPYLLMQYSASSSHWFTIAKS